MTSRFLLFSTLVFLFSTSMIFAQSCIIYKKEKDGIYLGADTRMVSYAINETGRFTEPVHSSICKMGNVNHVRFAITGYAADIALTEAKNILQGTKIFAEAIKQYTTSFGQKLANILEADRSTMLDYFKKKFPAGSTVGGSVFFYYENGLLVGRVIKIILVSQPTEKAVITTLNENIDSIGIAGSAIGIRAAILNKDVWKKGAAKAINNLIEIERMANPAEVGGVADILFVSSKNEMEWVQRKKCSNSN
ncbi:MAG: hypothetical protein H7122_14710 [Chitinophagaceae bacterium]|nr:hypothetical protein [Chitinophagaceae bacterium]